MKIIFKTKQRKSTTITPDDDLDIHELMDIIYNSLKSLTYSDSVILNGLNQLKQDIECE
jgi:hypothetical protein